MDGLQVMLQAPHGRINFRVAFVTMPGSDNTMIIGLNTPRKSLDMGIEQAFHQRVSETGELCFVTPHYAARADETISSVSRMYGPGSTLQGIPQPQAGDAFLPGPAG